MVRTGGTENKRASRMGYDGIKLGYSPTFDLAVETRVTPTLSPFSSSPTGCRYNSAWRLLFFERVFTARNGATERAESGEHRMLSVRPGSQVTESTWRINSHGGSELTMGNLSPNDMSSGSKNSSLQCAISPRILLPCNERNAACASSSERKSTTPKADL